jgi:Flp pilus assembly secretin CpaC
VTPTAAASLAAPTDGYIAPTDAETILLGRLNAVYDKPGSDAAKPNPSGSAGFIVQ